MPDATSRDWHFWSVSSGEALQLAYPDTVWRSEASFFAPQEENPSAVPVYRFFNADRQHHFWSTNRNEIAGGGFVLQGEAYSVFDAGKPAPPGTRPLQRYIATDQTGDYFHHFYTPTPEHELLELLRFEETVGHVYPSIAAASGNRVVEVYRWAMLTAYPSWTCNVVHGNGAVDHVGEDIDNVPEHEAQMICNGQLDFWAKVARKDPRQYRALIRRK